MLDQEAGHRRRIARVAVAVVGGLVLAAGSASPAGAQDRFTPGAPGAGDPYFPLDGNGGYETKRYFLDVKYNPATDVLAGVATIRARATQNLSRFNLDLEGLTVASVRVNGRRASWTRQGGELVITPPKGIPKGWRFTTVIEYSGIPQTLEDGSGFIHTDDGTLVIGEPHVADTWYPVNDHPSDKAAYTFRITVPAGLEAIANGVLERRRTRHGWTTWLWSARPMASYLTTASIGEFDLRAYRHDGIRFWDALDPDLFDRPAPRTGKQFAISQKAEGSYKRLSRRIAVPAGGATLSFWVARDTEQNWDYVFVEARTAGQNDWTTLRDLNGHTSQDTGLVCPYWLGLHPFLTHYQTENADGTCSPQGTSGEWWAASGWSNGYEQWKVDLSTFAGRTVQVSISYASDDLFQFPGVVVDDIVVSTGEGTTSFEKDGNTRDGWSVPGPPPGTAPNENDWIVGTAADVPAPLGETVEASFARQGEIIDFLEGFFGPYPFSAAGGVVDDLRGLGFALEIQTRPIYAVDFFTSQTSGDAVVVHELAHQWYGDSLTVARWRHIWLNEGFATYAEWLWSEREGLGTAQETFESLYNDIPADDPFWTVIIGNPGPDSLFDSAVYDRGAMTLHQLRLAVGDRDFFAILRRWATRFAGHNVATWQFIRLAERVSGEDLDALFKAWLFTPSKPPLNPTSAAAGSMASAGRETSTDVLAPRFRLGAKYK